jgi:excisionase family DNA binding protein
MNQIRRQLQALFAECESLCDADPDFFDSLELSQRIEAACRAGCRFGVETAEVGLVSAREGLAIVGRLLAATEEKPELLSVDQVARMLGISGRSVWRMLSSGELPSPIKIGGLTRWSREQIQAMIDLSAPIKR